MSTMVRRRPSVLWAATAALAAASSPYQVRGFTVPSAPGGPAAFLSARRDSRAVSRHDCDRPATALSMSSAAEQLKRRSVTIPLIDLSAESGSSLVDATVVPLPSSHLPEELTTLNVYGFEVIAPVHRMMVEDALARADSMAGEVSGLESCYGHIVQKDPGAEAGGDGEGEDEVHPLVGAVGCAAEVLLAGNVMREPPLSPKLDGIEGAAVAEAKARAGIAEKKDEKNDNGDDEEDESAEGEGGDPPLLVLARGSYRFVVREIVQTFPYPVGIVDELLDEEPVMPVRADEEEEDDDEDEDEDWDDEDDDDEDDWYLELTPAELVQRSLQTMKVLVEQGLNNQEKEPTPLEVAIMEDAGVNIQSAAAKRDQAEERAAVFEVFSSSLLDFAPTPIDRYSAIGWLGAELADVDNDVRRRLLLTRDGAERLRIVLRELDRKISAAATKKLTTKIENDAGGGQDLKVGTPTLPSWSKQIKKGTKVEYFWNEEWGWCGGYVSEDPVMIVDELILTVTFDSDGTVHKLPFNGEEKVRWRPG